MPYAFEGGISQDYIEGAVEISQEDYMTALESIQSGLVISVVDGFSVGLPVAETPPEPTQEEINARLGFEERQWREVEMLRIQENLTALSFGADDVPGTVVDWQGYWLSVRKWTDTNPDFPDSAKRPVAPT